MYNDRGGGRLKRVHREFHDWGIWDRKIVALDTTKIGEHDDERPNVDRIAVEFHGYPTSDGC
jgi:hypothetical protein